MDANRQTRDSARLRNFLLIFLAPRGLARRMLVWIIGISTTAALIATSVQLFFDYRSDVSELEQGMRYIEQSQLPGLADAAWNFNVAGMQVQLDGIGHSPWVAGATIHYGPSQSAALKTGKLDPDAGRLFEYVLRRNGVVVGKIYIEPNLHTLYRRTLDRIGIVLATQGGKSLVTSISILLLISWMITRHLTQMAEFAKSFEPGKRFTPFVLRRGPQGPYDELSVLVDRLNDAYGRLQTAHEFQVRHNEILSQEVTQRTTELLEAHRQLAQLAITDKLTGAVNRRGLDEAFKSAIPLADPDSRPLAVILADIDKFKSVNDSRGHLVGDILLREFTSILRRAARATDTVGRWGGEEFLILCPQTTLEQALRLAEHLRASVQAHVFAEIGSKTSSFGVAVLRKGETADDLVKRADEALYQAKEGGRNRVCPEAPDIES
ncbi:diguanylate cyclase [Chromobacterium piscinae]|uniref:sensor domain-containing diguanylate cyclase n=1 Tax=Chromobacterium piscinae TaxID=686831 RepID=UPI001C8C24FE|nr:GGDEF domain-containing protein [Chromobacterium piscinae]MBX9295397.1 diguanylate cyclase [Chromobacterium vaccinii]MBX9347316.1 diguanylate cyclase [Chromobacterium vaccinii]MBX9356406.1 diguanylate cyclase [Chromobacterium vaccinii]MCD4505881.1 diguanylate cyclase [Chromobacterium piscinae]MCD5326299.1 diguanylate cyclase [Chromobacterium piscinae]